MRLNKNLAILLSGQLVSQLGDKFYLLALSFWVLEATQSASMMGIVLFCSLFPEVVSGVLAGAIVDRYSRKWIIVATDLIRGGIVLGLSLLFYFDQVALVWIIIAQVLLSISTAFFNPCIPAVIPQIVKQENLAKANSQTQLIRGISTVLGPVLGGISVAAFGYLFVFVFNGLSFIISGVCELFLTIPEEKQHSKASGLVDDVKEGIHYIIKEKSLLTLLGFIAMIHFFVGSFQTITPVLAKVMTGVAVQNLGFIQTAFGLGMVFLSLVFGVKNLMHKRERFTLFVSVFFIGVVNVAISLLVFNGTESVFLYLVPFFVYGGSVILAVTAFRTLVQQVTPNKMAGRVFGVAFSVGDASIPMAMLIYGFLLDYFAVSYLLTISGMSLMLLSVIFARKVQPISSMSSEVPA
ncbi:MAG: MFS transporter [Proteobacteria bacterium]|nr:MFS transporter [Pseudomonadota bacterium]